MTAKILYNPRSFQPSEKLLRFVEEEKSLQDHYLFQSSGSTGKPKWVALSASALESSAKAVNEHLELSSKDILGLPLPDFHVGGFGMIERARLADAKLARYKDRWSAETFSNWCESEKISISSLVPAQIYDLVQKKIPVPRSLRAVVVGGGALPEALYFGARELGWPLLLSYGLTECCSQVATSELSSLKIPPQERLWPQAKILSHMEAKQISEQRVSVKSKALLSFYLLEEENAFSLVDPKIDGAFVLPDKVSLKGNTLLVSGRWEQDYKILGEWIRWDYLKKKFAETCVREKQFLRYEIEMFSDDRSGNKIVFICEKFDEAAQKLARGFNSEVFPFERITHYYEGNLQRSELGKVLRLKINPICLKEISG